ncbi:MAG: hypothetical protein FK733_04475 [Asgard group archaeon]|nr:hypothetical protein [Asgard group archaeon]
MTSEELEVTRLAEKFYHSLRGFIVIEESGLPKYIEFLTEEQFDVLLLAGFLTSLQSFSEIISEENIQTIETSNSILLFKMRRNYFYVFWIEKGIINLDMYEPIIIKLISRFEGSSSSDNDNTLLISNLTETPDFEKFGQRIVKFQTMVPEDSEVYKELFGDIDDKKKIEKITKELLGLDGILVIKDSGEIEHTEFPRGEPSTDINTLTRFLIGLRKVIKNIDPGNLEEVTTSNFRFVIQDKQEYFYVFEVIKGFAEKEEPLQDIILRLASRYEGLRGKTEQPIKLLDDLESTPEHELLGRLSIEMKGRQNGTKKPVSLNRQTSKITFGNLEDNWKKEEEQFNTFMEIYSEIFLTGIICPEKRYFIMEKTIDSNDWINTANELELEKLLALTPKQAEKKVAQVRHREKIFLVTRITDEVILFVIVDKLSPAVETYMLRMVKILQRISQNISS